MSTEEVFVQEFARLFVHYRDALMLDSPTEQQIREWNEIPGAERERMVAAARLALVEIESVDRTDGNSRRYYAKPGEAEWGC
jgi:hypothetical protein